jgi:hypothetical protein
MPWDILQRCLYRDNTLLNGGMSDELESVLEGSGTSLIDVLSQHLPGRTEEKAQHLSG